MTDREMLELAALAAGIERGADRIDCGISITGADGRHTSLPRWNSRDDDGDALRLAVDLRMAVLVGDGGNVRVSCQEDSDTACSAIERIGNDIRAATRLAITRAAAEVGRKMREGKE